MGQKGGFVWDRRDHVKADWVSGARERHTSEELYAVSIAIADLQLIPTQGWLAAYVVLA